MKPLLILAALLVSTPVLAQETTPGAHFISNWDLDGNGSVSLDEATERRADIFATFDADGNGALTAEEYGAMDEARAADQAAMGGQGKGHGNPEEMGMMRGFNDGNGDGTVTRDEFMARVPDWFARMDRNGDQVITVDDFGPGK